MSEKHLYSFGEFSLNAEDHILTRDGENVPVTPKMFDLLLVFVQNPGRVLGKEFLLQTVWPDSFVEEGNITFNIRQLRKALDDDVQAPKFIETIPRRGYRFVAEVDSFKTVAPDKEDSATSRTLESAAVVEQSSTSRRYILITAAALAIVVGVLGIGSWFLKTKGYGSAPILSTAFASEKLSTSGVVYGAAISPDGKTVVYSNRTGTKQGVWLRDLDTGSNVPLIQPSDDNYFVFNFSPDGKTLYFSRSKSGLDSYIEIYRIPLVGGIPEVIASKTEGWIGISPDGEKISYVRCPRTEDEHCGLYLADSRDGKNERKLVTRKAPLRIADNQVSPDGKSIAFAAGQSRNAANEFQLFSVDLATGVEREMTSERFFNIKSLVWLPDNSGVLCTASQVQNKYFRVWLVSSTAGTAESLTKDSEAYGILSLDREAKRLVATQIKQDFRLNLFNVDDLPTKTFVADAARASFAPDGRVYFASTMSGNDEIWSSNQDGTGHRQLTNDPAGDGSPIVSADSKTVFFASNRSGKAQIWRMNVDGSAQTQVTQTEGGAPTFASPDGKLVYYKHSISATLWSVSVESGEERLVLDKSRPDFQFSPDGLFVGVEEKTENGVAIAVHSVSDGRLVRTFDLANERPRLIEFAWTPDGKSIMYIMSAIEYDKNKMYQQPFEGGPWREVGSLGDDDISEASGLSFSPDGKKFTLVQGGWQHDAVMLTGLR